VAVEEVHSILRQIVARTIESDDCKGLAQFTLLKREIATTAATSLESMKEDARKMVQTMVEMESSYLTAEIFKEILSQSGNAEGSDLLRTLSGRPVSLPHSACSGGAVRTFSASLLSPVCQTALLLCSQILPGRGRARGGGGGAKAVEGGGGR
jgi:hypothetical protein